MVLAEILEVLGYTSNNELKSTDNTIKGTTYVGRMYRL